MSALNGMGFDAERAARMANLKNTKTVKFRGLTAHIRKAVIDLPANKTFTASDVLHQVKDRFPGIDAYVIGSAIACMSRVSPHLLRRVNGQKSGMYERLSLGTVTQVPVTTDTLWDQVYDLLNRIRMTSQSKEAQLDRLLGALKGLD